MCGIQPCLTASALTRTLKPHTSCGRAEHHEPVRRGVTVPAWTTGDYDSLYVVTVNYTTNGITAQFHRDSEGLNN